MSLQEELADLADRLAPEIPFDFEAYKDLFWQEVAGDSPLATDEQIAAAAERAAIEHPEFDWLGFFHEFREGIRRQRAMLHEEGRAP